MHSHFNFGVQTPAYIVNALLSSFSKGGNEKAGLTCCLHETRGGATAVEFAIMLPIFLALTFGIVVFGSDFAMIHGVQ